MIINYVYDPLYRLKEANYSTGDTYHYAYDAVGNRKTQASMVGGLLSNDSYNYDNANRLTDVNGVTYTWDDNGNLLNDGMNTYQYDSANRLIRVSNHSSMSSYRYNGLGDRLQETTIKQTTTFTMDLNAGLTQALSDGTNSYIYGLDRVAQVQGETTEYFLGDALGSVRQMTDANAEITYASGYDPYGVATSTVGTSQSAYGYTGEYTDSYIKLIYLRSRWYDPASGRFTTQDSWQGDYNRPLSLNRWNYVEGNPINRSDPSGHCFNQADGTWHWFERPWFGNCQNSSAQNSSIQLPPPEPSSLLCRVDPVTTPWGSTQYDLTGYLALAMSVHGVDARIRDIANQNR